MRTKRTWHKGPPPHIGWWNASMRRLTQYWRWWNGVHWTGPAMNSDSAEEALEWAMQPAYLRDDIEWSDYYPADARVPRLDPAEGWVLNTGTMPKSTKRIEVAYRDGVRQQAWYAAQGFWDLKGNNLDIYAWRPAP